MNTLGNSEKSLLIHVCVIDLCGGLWVGVTNRILGEQGFGPDVGSTTHLSRTSHGSLASPQKLFLKFHLNIVAVLPPSLQTHNWAF